MQVSQQTSRTDQCSTPQLVQGHDPTLASHSQSQPCLIDCTWLGSVFCFSFCWSNVCCCWSEPHHYIQFITETTAMNLSFKWNGILFAVNFPGGTVKDQKKKSTTRILWVLEYQPLLPDIFYCSVLNIIMNCLEEKDVKSHLHAHTTHTNVYTDLPQILFV